MDHETRVKESLAAVEALEAQADIVAKMKRAAEGRFIPLGALPGERDVSPEEYFASEFDHRRRHTRDAYFGVADVALRKQLIEARCEYERLFGSQRQTSVNNAQRELYKARQQSFREPWFRAGVFAAGMVALGTWLFAIPGAIGGATLGWFLGYGHVAVWRLSTVAEIAQAQAELDDAFHFKKKYDLYPALFSEHEAYSGQEDAAFGNESAQVNVLQSEAKAAS